MGSLSGSLAVAWWAATALAFVSTGPLAAACMGLPGLGMLWLVHIAVREAFRGYRVRLDPQAVTVDHIRFGRPHRSWRIPLRALRVSTRVIVDTAERTIVGLDVEDGESELYLPPGPASAEEMRWLAGILDGAAAAARAVPPGTSDAEAMQRLQALLARQALSVR